MFLSVGVSGGLSKFSKIEQILLVNHNVSFLCCNYDSWYVEHIRSYELSTSNTSLSVHLQSGLNDTLPLGLQDRRLAAADPQAVHSSETELLNLAVYKLYTISGTLTTCLSFH